MTPADRAAPTLEEVARAAGVSRATASRAVTGAGKVSARAREAVAAAVEELGYRPNRAARALVTRRTGSVAVVLPEPDHRVFADPFFARTLRGVGHVLAEREVQLVLLLAPEGAGAERTLRYLATAPVDGVLVVSGHRDEVVCARVVDSGLPCVAAGRPWDPRTPVSYVDVDNALGGRRATEHLLGAGRARVGHVAGPPDMTAAVDRLRGWREALAEAGAPADAVEHGDFTEAGGRRAAERLLAAYPDLDALVVASDLMARGVLQVLADSGRRVPDDVAVVGYDDLGSAEATTPPLTTVRQPVGEMAERATLLLLDQLEHGTPATPEVVVLPPELVVRASG